MGIKGGGRLRTVAGQVGDRKRGQGTSNFDNTILFLGRALGGDTLGKGLVERRGFPGIAGHRPVGRRPGL